MLIVLFEGVIGAINRAGDAFAVLPNLQKKRRLIAPKLMTLRLEIKEADVDYLKKLSERERFHHAPLLEVEHESCLAL